MGAWGIGILENDMALDLMIELKKCGNIRGMVEKIILDTDFIEEKLLAVEIIDISINGIDESILGNMYEYLEWFENLEKNPMEDLKLIALDTLEYVKKHDCGWFPICAKDRAELLKEIERRLKTEEKDDGQ